ncbi:class I SAM-dependent methyltransferase [Pseudorhodoplanes sp.]|uniref:class I SAM-dependent methyltransferase n=1 Tax=Pseudorhodoplanes sp. TaxID=1934341 RepID=UPI003D0F906C
MLEVNTIEMDPPARDPEYEKKLALGKELNEALELYRLTEELDRLAAVIKAQSVGDKLTPSQYAQLKAHQEDTMAVEQRRKYFRETDHRSSFHGIAYYAIKSLLGRDSSIRSILNIGCNYGYMDYLLAKEHGLVSVLGVDVNDDTPSKNADLVLPNLNFRAGYALDLLEAGDIRADLVYMSSTATVIRNEEIRRYLRVLSGSAKYVLFSEPVWLRPGNVLQKGLDISVTESVPAYVQRNPLTGSYGYLCWNHNYAGLLESEGFEVIDYRFYRPEFTYLYWCLALGQNTNARLWE